MDNIGDLLTRIRNAGLAGHEKVDIPSSNLRVGVAQILAKEGVIRSFKVAKDSKQGIMRVYLKYDDKGKHVVTTIQRVSKPGCRVYIKSDEIPVIRSGLGFCVLSTNKGLMSGNDAIKEKIGGELICKVW
jgi:small subunit ribosomal protein S8